MNGKPIGRIAIAGGICGALGTICYILAIFVPMSDTVSYAVIMLWPVLSIVFAACMFTVIRDGGGGLLNLLAFVFALLAFATVATMISIQLAVQMGLAEYGTSTGADPDSLRQIGKVTRMVDLGVDVAWDWLIGVCLVFLGFAVGADRRFGKVWGALASMLGAGLVILNTITFPWPPDTRGLFDLGPFIGVFIIAISIRLLVIGLRVDPRAVLENPPSAA